MSNYENYLESSGNDQQESKDYGIDVASFNNYNSLIDGNQAQNGGKYENQARSGFVSDNIDEEKEYTNREIINYKIIDNEKEIKENLSESNFKKNFKLYFSKSVQNNESNENKSQKKIEIKSLENEARKNELNIVSPIIVNSISSIINDLPLGKKSNLLPQDKMNYQNEIQKLKKDYEDMRKKYKEDLKNEEEKIELLEKQFQ